jgi:hypothetical protein
MPSSARFMEDNKTLVYKCTVPIIKRVAYSARILPTLPQCICSRVPHKVFGNYTKLNESHTVSFYLICNLQ